ncbi:MAG: hypothetical protein ACQEQJ_03495, partial [Halobacteriota archaeon]
TVAVGIAAVILLVFLGAGAAYLSEGAGGAPVVVLLAMLGLTVAYLLLAFFIQFYPQAIVLDGQTAVGGLKHSAGVVRANPLATLGYSLLVGFVAGLLGLFGSVLSILASPRAMGAITGEAVPLEWILGMGLLGGVLTIVVGTFLAIYSVSFYRAVTT